ncbi:hypothetical protein Z950_2321 [Sulfitobacter mediterraneus KCTC 32188]|nr:hypothetical protein Z950_2321 [Sulfitobacter mediterraneus KCTC 32188]
MPAFLVGEGAIVKPISGRFSRSVPIYPERLTKMRSGVSSASGLESFPKS